MKRMVLKKRLRKTRSLDSLSSPEQVHVDKAMEILYQATLLIDHNKERWVPCSQALHLYDRLAALYAGVHEHLGETDETTPVLIQENIDFVEKSIEALKNALDDCFQPDGVIGLWVGRSTAPTTPSNMLNGLEVRQCDWH